MSDFIFACPSCKKDISVEQAMRGQKVTCPYCNNDSLVPPAEGKGRLSVVAHTPTGGHASAPSPMTPPPAAPKKKVGRSVGTPTWIKPVVMLAALAVGLYFADQKFGLLNKAKGLVGKGEEETEAGASNDLAQADAAAATNVVTEPPPVYTTNIAEARIPSGPVAGFVGGTNFQADLVQLAGNVLVLRQGTNIFDRDLMVYLPIRPGEPVDGKTFTMNSDQRTGPRVLKRWVHNPRFAPQQKSFSGGYAMKLEFGQNANGRIPGKIYLALPDTEQTFVAGTFQVDPAATAAAQQQYQAPTPQPQANPNDARFRQRYGVQQR